ncbi:MAG: hypothetical protein J4F47_11860 [Alphaproteobacteria bacterium]|nr:hypothetical protein [Alphaproteobacteria bacterium]
MRTTLTFDDRIARQLKDIADHSGKTVRGGGQRDLPEASAGRHGMDPVEMGDVADCHDLNKALCLADQLEDQELRR